MTIYNKDRKGPTIPFTDFEAASEIASLAVTCFGTTIAKAPLLPGGAFFMPEVRPSSRRGWDRSWYFAGKLALPHIFCRACRGASGERLKRQAAGVPEARLSLHEGTGSGVVILGEVGVAAHILSCLPWRFRRAVETAGGGGDRGEAVLARRGWERSWYFARKLALSRIFCHACRGVSGERLLLDSFSESCLLK